MKSGQMYGPHFRYSSLPARSGEREWEGQPVQAQQQISYPQRVRSTQFGDGYEQVSGDGINPETIQVPITWTGARSEALALRNFLRRHAVKSFFFTPPFESKGLYRVTPDSINLVPVAANVATVTATLKQAHSV